jgi:prepilin-type N-terminal cleavage/methylation domain-containing protein
MMPDPARSRVERRWRLAGRHRGFSLLEVLFVVALIVTITGICVPLCLSTLDGLRTQGAARYLAGRLNLARMEAVKRSVNVAMRVEGADTGYRYTFYADGNRNGVLTHDINRGVDRATGPPECLGEKFGGVVFGILRGVTAIDGSDPLDASSDPVRFGRSDLLSFSPTGSATAGTFYLHGRKQQMAVRVLGVTGRVRVLRFDFNAARWVSQ